MNYSFFFKEPIVKEGLPAELHARKTFPLMRTLSPPWANWAGVMDTPYGDTKADPRATYALQFVRPVQEVGRLTDPSRPMGERILHFAGPVRFTRADEEREQKNALYEKRRRLRDTYRGYLSEQRKTEAFRREER